QGTAGQAEGMKHRQGIEHDILCGEIDARRGLEAIGLQVAVGEDDALRNPLRSGCEENDRRRIAVGIPPAAAQRDAWKFTREEAVELVGKTQIVAQILEIDDCAFLGEKSQVLLKAAGFDELAR